MITVQNDIRIDENQQMFLNFCNRELILDNPEYYRLEKMGKWTGNTPKTISLFEKDGNNLIVPFGCLKKLWKLFPQGNWTSKITPIRHLKYKSNIELYDYQQTAVEAVLKAKNGILVMPCGAGKTVCGIEIISRIGGKALWLTHTSDLLNQSKKRAESVLEIDSDNAFGTITAGKVDIGTHITFATVQTMSKINLAKYKDEFDVIIVDECMPGNTLIDTPNGKKQLKNLKNGDIITSYNRSMQKTENKKITHVFKNKTHDIIKIKLSNGKEIICTKNHPIFTKKGDWIEAERLTKNDYVLRLVRQGSGNGQYAVNDKKQNPKKGLLLLLKRMLSKGRTEERYMDKRAKEKNVRDNGSYKQEICERKNEKKQSYEKCGNETKGFKEVKRNRTSPKNKMWKWCRVDCASTKFNACTFKHIRRLCRISNTDKTKGEWLSNLLQSRHSNTRRDDCNRSGREFTLCVRTTSARQKERRIFKWIRVESVEVQKQTSDGTFGGLCSDGYVYNIEVEDNNNYFANDILVHNCHHCCGSPTRVTQFYKVVSSLSARYKIGLTATPKRADGLHVAMLALLGDIIYEGESVMCPIKVKQVETNWYPDTDKILNGDGTIDYNALINELTEDTWRFQKVVEYIKKLDGAKLVLGNRLLYLEVLRDLYGGNSVFINGSAQTQKAKRERKEALEKLNNGEIDCVFATFQLAREGLDCPNLRYVVFATPEKNATTIIQSVGRVGRIAKGKEYGTVIDFVDDFGIYQNWAAIRRKYYRKLGAEVL